MGNLLRVLNDKGPVPKIDFFVDFESEFVCLLKPAYLFVYFFSQWECDTGIEWYRFYHSYIVCV